MIDYLTISVHYNNREQYHFVQQTLMCVTMTLPPISQKAVYPYNYCEDYYRYGTLMCRVRYSHKSLYEGFVTFDLFGSYFSVTEWEKRIQRLIDCVSLCCEADSVKIARIDLRLDFEEYDTSYNPNNLHVNKMFDTGSGQPTYYFGSNESEIRVYDKKAELFDTEGLEIETPRLTRFEYQFRDRYLKKEYSHDFLKLCDDWLSICLLRDFNIDLTEDSIYGKLDIPKSYRTTTRNDFDIFKPYCTLASYIISNYGEDAFLNYIYIHSKVNNKYKAFSSKELKRLSDSLPKAQTFEEFLIDKLQYEKYLFERNIIQ